jgi:GNAT superfamily N-acetyltransferase
MRAASTHQGPPLGTVIVSVDHPSFTGDIDRFLCELRNEPRYFGPTASTNPKPFPSLIEALRGRGGFRVAAVECGRIVGLARVDGSGEMFLAVVADRRSAGIGVALCRTALVRAAELHYRKVVVRSTRRSRAARRMAEQIGCLVVEHDHGRTDLVLDPRRVGRPLTAQQLIA